MTNTYTTILGKVIFTGSMTKVNGTYVLPSAPLRKSFSPLERPRGRHGLTPNGRTNDVDQGLDLSWRLVLGRCGRHEHQARKGSKGEGQGSSATHCAHDFKVASPVGGQGEAGRS